MNTLRYHNLLVCGGAGFIGSNFIRHMLSGSAVAKIINLDKLTYAGNLENLADASLDPRYVFIKGDIADAVFVKSVFEKYRPDYVVNFAAATHVDRSIYGEAEEFVHTNVHGTFCVLEAARKCGQVQKFIQVSTDEVYGDLALDSTERFHEGSALRPNSPYASTKAAGDLLCRSYFRTYGLPAIVTRCGNNYGPYQYPEKLIPFSILRIFENKKVPIYGDGLYVRDWIYVMDHCRALEQCLGEGQPGEVYNIGAEKEFNNLEIARRILGYFGKDESWIEFVADRPGHDRRYALDPTKIKSRMGWRPEVSFEDGFQKTVRWFMDNKVWIKNIRKRVETLNPHIPRP